MILLAGNAILRQYVEPIVLGKISEKTRISKVKTADTTPIKKLVSSLVLKWSDAYPAACEPTREAPTVFAMVLTTRMADIGRSMLVLNFFKRCHPGAFCVSSVDMYDIGVDKSVASRSEHIAEITKASSMNMIKRESCWSMSAGVCRY